MDSNSTLHLKMNSMNLFYILVETEFITVMFCRYFTVKQQIFFHSADSHLVNDASDGGAGLSGVGSRVAEL